MSFSGTLEHLPIVDVIQLLHSSRKNGTLVITSSKGESQLVFQDGYFVGANHMDNSVRIGQILIQMNALTHDELERALTEQKTAGKERKPLVATLIEQGIVDRDTAYRGLESLIEMTIVEVLTWTSGSFTFDVALDNISDEYRYFPEKLHQEILINAQAVLMDALRIFDEKMRDGTLSTLFFSDNDNDETVASSEPTNDITADILGLNDVDNLTRKIPGVFTAFIDKKPLEEHRKHITDTLPGLPSEHLERLVSFLCSVSQEVPAPTSQPQAAIILLTKDNLLAYTITTVSREKHLLAFATDDEASLDLIIEQSLGRDLHPVLLLDAPHESDNKMAIDLLKQKQLRYPQISTLLMACCRTWRSISLPALETGTRAVLPRPCRTCNDSGYIDDLISFLSAIRSYLIITTDKPYLRIEKEYLSALKQLDSLESPPEIASVMLGFIAAMFDRALTFVVAKSELIAEKSIGISTEKGAPPSPPLMFRIPLDRQSIFSAAVEQGQIIYGQRSDSLLTSNLYQVIKQPHSSKVMLLPMICRKKVVALIYADFGEQAVSPPRLDLLEALARYAELILDNSLYQKKLEGPIQRTNVNN